MAYTIREATASDLPTILDHRRQMFFEMGYTDAAALDAMQRTTETLLARGMAEGFYRGWLVEGAGRAVAGGGIFMAEWPSHPRGVQTRRVEIVNIYTDPEHRRRGLARLVMQTILAWCRAEGFCTVVLHASKDGRALYESLGFQPTNEMRLTIQQP
jgi:ribosomal protein S18 acetylase RimI-like enzyme